MTKTHKKSRKLPKNKMKQSKVKEDHLVLQKTT